MLYNHSITTDWNNRNENAEIVDLGSAIDCKWSHRDEVSLSMHVQNLLVNKSVYMLYSDIVQTDQHTLGPDMQAMDVKKPCI